MKTVAAAAAVVLLGSSCATAFVLTPSTKLSSSASSAMTRRVGGSTARRTVLKAAAKGKSADKAATKGGTKATKAPEAPKAADFDLKKYLGSKKVDVEAALEASIESVGPETDKICESMKYSLMAGGKRVRPIMCIAACELFGGTQEQAMPTAVSLEMIHTMSLIHDDLPAMDDDDLRRGSPTNHVVYGEDIAILAGDALLSKSFEHCAKHTKGVAAENIVQVIVRLGQAVSEVGLAGGQVMDLICEGKDDVTLEDLRWIHKHKTAALLKVACTAGALLAGAGEEDVANMEVFSDSIGLAFQVADDILDCTGTSEELGKTAGKDEAVSKTTYVKLLGMEGAKKEAKRLAEEATAALEPYGEKADALRAIANYIVDRKN